LVFDFILADDYFTHFVADMLHQLRNCLHYAFSFRTP
jgi:hypothetical protein